MSDKFDEDRFVTGGALDAIPKGETDAGIGLVGRQLGDYRIVAAIGEGGMSQIYRGERIDGTFTRDVAIKVSAGSALSEQLLDRFSREQQILAGLNHPNISQLYDAGITLEGWPYIVMELVEGRRIDEYCVAHQLGPQQVSKLITQATNAIAFAHAQLIVHRDIKPANVLVTESGEVKLLDFGIAKLLAGDAENTQAQPMTPRYASPEQLLGEPVAVASDVYQLGLLLGNLLTDNALQSEVSMTDVVKRAASGQELRISTDARKMIPPELAAIVEHCLFRDPDARYASASLLLSDLNSYLGGYPVQAVGAHLFYRMGKFIRRNAYATAITALTIATLLASSIWYTNSIAQARDVAAKRADASNRMLRAMSQLFSETLTTLVDFNAENKAGGTTLVETMMDDAIVAVEQELAAGSAARAEILRLKANMETLLGDLDQAEEDLIQAQAFAVADEATSTEVQVIIELAGLENQRGNADKARNLLDKIAPLVEANNLPQRTLRDFFFISGRIYELAGDYGASEEDLLAALAIAQAGEDLAVRDRVRILNGLADTYAAWRRPRQAIEVSEQAIGLLDGDGLSLNHNLIPPLRAISDAASQLEDLDLSESALHRVLEVSRANFGPNHSSMGKVYNSLGGLAYDRRQFDEAIKHYREAQRIATEVYGVGSEAELVERYNLISPINDKGEVNEAIRLRLALIEDARKLGPEGQRIVMFSINSLGRAAMHAGDYENAAEYFRQSHAAFGQTFGTDNLATVGEQYEMAVALLRAGRVEEAKPHYTAVMQSLETEPESFAHHQLRGWRFFRQDDESSGLEKLRLYLAQKIAAGEINNIYWVEHFAEQAYMCVQSGDFDCARDALAHGDLGAAIAPAHPWSHALNIARGAYLVNLGHGHEAVTELAASVDYLSEHYPGHSLWINRGVALIDQ